MSKIERLLIAALAFAAPMLLSGLAFAQGAGPSVVVHGAVAADAGYISWGETNANSATGKAIGELFTSTAVNLNTEVMLNNQLSAIVGFQFFGIANSTNNNLNVAAGNPDYTGGNAAFATGGNGVDAEVHWRPSNEWDISAGQYLFPEWAAPMTEQVEIFSNPLNFFVLPAGGIYTGGATSMSIPGTNNMVWLQENTFIWNHESGANVDYKMGGTEFGVALSPNCVGEGVANQYCHFANQNTMSIVPHFLGKYGDLSITAQVDSESGTMADSQAGGGTCALGATPTGPQKACTGTVSVSSLGYMVGAAYKFTSDIRLGVDVSGWDVSKQSKLGDGADGVWANYGARLDISQLMLYVYSTTYNPFYANPLAAKGFNMTAKSDVSNTAAVIRYKIPTAGGVTLMPELRTITLGKAGTNSSGKLEDLTDTTIDIIAKVGF